MIELNADLKQLPYFLGFAHDCADEMGFEKSSIMQIELALEEVIVNIINYAYPEKTGKIALSCQKNDDTLIMQIVDSGVQFDMMAASDPDLDVSLEDRKIGGLGVFFVKQLMDTVVYERCGDKNILTLKKKK